MIIEARNIMYSYKSKRDTLVLKQVSATFEEGIFYAIVGPSGSGKTTFLSLLAGLDSPVSGNILFNGEDIQKKGLNYHRRHDISLVFQNYNLIDYLTTEENVKLGGKEDAEKLLKEVGIPSEDWKRNVLQLSGGQQHGNLDEDTSAGVIELLKSTAHESGKCVIVVTHSRQLAEEADEVLEIKDGKLKKV